MNAANLARPHGWLRKRWWISPRTLTSTAPSTIGEKFRTMLELSRKQVADQLGVDGNEVALVRNTSEANNIITMAFRSRREMRSLWDQKPSHQQCRLAGARRPLQFKRQASRDPTKEPTRMDQLDCTLCGSSGSQTRVLALTHVSNVSGVLLPIRELCELAHRRNIHVHVDGAQTLGRLQTSTCGASV